MNNDMKSNVFSDNNDIFNSGKFPRLRIIYKELAETREIPPID